jgi:hypothetical protein
MIDSQARQIGASQVCGRLVEALPDAGPRRRGSSCDLADPPQDLADLRFRRLSTARS